MKKKTNRGFTLVEVLAIITILAIIMLIAIPSVLDVIAKSNRVSFNEYVEKLGNIAAQKYWKENINDKDDGCYIYNIQNDLDIDNTGSFKGYVLINSINDDTKYYITLWDNDHMLVAYNFSDKIDYKGKHKSIKEAVEMYDASREEELTPSYLCNYACKMCTYDNATSDPYENITEPDIKGDVTKIKGVTVLVGATEFKNAIKAVAGSLDNVHTFKVEYELPTDVTTQIISKDDGTSLENPVYIWYEDNIIHFYSEATKIFLNPDSSKMFASFKNVEDFGDIIKETSANKVVTMADMFNSSGMTKLDLSNWETPLLQYMNGMFAGTTNLKELNLDGLNTSKVTRMDYLFNSSGIEYVDLSMLDTSSLQKMELMFSASQIIEPDMSTWETPNLKQLNSAFKNCKNLKKLDLNKLNTKQVTALSSLFEGCSNLEELNISNWNTSNVTSMNCLFKGCSKLLRLDIANWNVSKVSGMSEMFLDCKKLISLDVSKWNTQNVTTMNSTFNGTTNLPELDISNWNVKNVKSFSGMFKGCGVTQFDFSKWETPSLTNIKMMFYGSHAYNLDLRSFDVSNCDSFQALFHFVWAETIDISTWDTAKNTSLSRTFANTGIRHVYVGPKWSIENVQTSTGIETFHECSKIYNYANDKSYKRAYVGEGGYFEYPPITK